MLLFLDAEYNKSHDTFSRNFLKGLVLCDEKRKDIWY